MNKLLPLVLGLLLSGTAWAQPSGDIIDTARDAGNLDKLLEMIDAAGIADELRSAGPFTLFAPTDEAFAALPDAALELLMEPESHDRLVALLHNHVVAGKLEQDDLDAGEMASNPTQAPLTIENLDGGSLVLDGAAGLSVDGATITRSNIEASNGVIHTIDKVLLPDAT